MSWLDQLDLRSLQESISRSVGEASDLINTVQQYDILNLDKLAEAQEQEALDPSNGLDVSIVHHHFAAENDDAPHEVAMTEPAPVIVKPAPTRPVVKHVPNMLMLDDFGMEEEEEEEDAEENDLMTEQEPGIARLTEGGEQQTVPSTNAPSGFDISGLWTGTDIFRDGILRIDDSDDSSEESERSQSDWRAFPLAESGKLFTTPKSFFDNVDDVDLESDPILKRVEEKKMQQQLFQDARFFSIAHVSTADEERGQSSRAATAAAVRTTPTAPSTAGFTMACRLLLKFIGSQLQIVTNQWIGLFVAVRDVSSARVIALEFALAVFSLPRFLLVVIVQVLLFALEAAVRLCGWRCEVTKQVMATTRAVQSVAFSSQGLVAVSLVLLLTIGAKMWLRTSAAVKD